ncbi:nuclear transport factor 2 family protein [Microbulbifer sp. Q7]|uniref:nuclear transport factor 2 family protein n=1 Tax=Microbulbifer sp. Q7 TaxID=1785091 RepID=UPI0008325C9C|nr:nuclear transport factor 2 family protein [Microbulbifer sp. Q7]
MTSKAAWWLKAWVLCWAVFAQAVWASSGSAVEQAEKVVGAQLDAFHRAAAEADFDTYFNILSSDGVFIGTDATERWPAAEFKKFVRPYFSQGKGWTYVPRGRTIVLHNDVAWFDELLDSEAYGECRGSGVLVKKDGQWKIAQYNLHFPVPNDLAKSITQMIKAHQSKDG